jgi:NADH-quinone oxidoreductase subunit J
MNVVFYVASAIAILSTSLVITGRNAVHAVLLLVVSLFAVAVTFATLGAPFVAALEVIVYAGAVMVLFIFVVMLLNVSPGSREQEGRWFKAAAWGIPLILGIVLLATLATILLGRSTPLGGVVIGPTSVGTALFSTYLIGVELASLLMLAGVVGAYHLGHHQLFGTPQLDGAVQTIGTGAEQLPEVSDESVVDVSPASGSPAIVAATSAHRSEK